jgi:hypothetical protein
MARTRQELAKAVLQELGELDAMEEPAAEDAALIKRTYDDKLEQMRDDDLVYWSADEIPNAIFLPLKDLVTNEVRGAFGEPMPAADKQAQEDFIMKRIRKHMARPATGLPTKADYF